MKRLIPLLAILTAAAAERPTANANMLKQAAKSVEIFWDQLQAVNCVESVDQRKLNPSGKLMFRRETEFDYIALLQLTGNDLIVDESRNVLHQPEHESRIPLLITNGFPTFELIFHPFYQGAFEFSAPESVQVEGQSLFQVHFRHVRGARSPSVLKLKQREYPLDWQGTAWLEPQSGNVVRVSASLMEGAADLGLKSLSADVRYARTEFKGERDALWLPSSAVVELETEHQRWRNTHIFSKYKRFAVDVKTEVGPTQ